MGKIEGSSRFYQERRTAGGFGQLPQWELWEIVKTSSRELELSVPRDRNGEFEHKVIKKYQTDIFGIEDKIISL